jgi:hypothetical protein
VFDSADDLEDLQLESFFPSTSWGHIIVTSRDQVRIGEVTQQQHVLDLLSTEEAIKVLAEKASLKDLSDTDTATAKAIVKQLGCLPLAIDQAGAFIKTRHKSLRDYLRLFNAQQHELLKWSPKLAQNEHNRTVITSWEVNFRQLERDSIDATNLLMLFCFLDPNDISEITLARGYAPQRRWGTDGEICEVLPTDTGLKPAIVNLLASEMDFDAAIDHLISFSLIERNDRRDDITQWKSFSLHPLVQYCAAYRLSPKAQAEWRARAILLLCHSFPQNQYLET